MTNCALVLVNVSFEARPRPRWNKNGPGPAQVVPQKPAMVDILWIATQLSFCKSTNIVVCKKLSLTLAYVVTAIDY
jgi:hypothetical protein